MKRYNPKEIEPKWQRQWEEQGIYKATEDPSRPKKYVLEYFPYPSGAAMHVGHVRNYTIGDAVARFNRMQGKNVLHPMGWDAFGLPAENYAIKTGINPRDAIKQNTAHFKQQLMQMGFSYDWSREINSTDPKYYKWTQWFFLLLFKKGLAYQQESLQWWCPFDKTVLANEQVEAGRCWRCGHEVEKKSLKQWFFKITDYVDRLLDDLDDLDWSESIKSMQRNWIGRSKGAEIEFKVDRFGETIPVFTTRPDTLFGATFVVLAPEHALVSKITLDPHKQSVNTYVKAAESRSDIERQDTNREKTGVFTGAYAINPINQAKIPIWVADYVLGGYGTGAIMAVPGHDDRDLQFAKKFDLPVKYVVEPVVGKKQGDEIEKEAIVAIVRNPKTNKILVLDWGPRKDRWGGNLFVGGGLGDDETATDCAIREVHEETGYKNLKYLSSLPYFVHSYYFSNVKNRNYYAKIQGILFDLVDEAKDPVSLDPGEKGKFSLKWVDSEAVARLIEDDGHRHIFEALVDAKGFEGEGQMTDSGSYDGRSSSDVREMIVQDLEHTKNGKEVVNYKMRDWLISRQRYWGAPIPIIHCPKDGAVAVPDDQLPVILPEINSYEPSGDGRSPLATVASFVKTICPKCGGPAERETDTMDGFACSSWYFLRFADPHNDDEPFSKTKSDFWLPVDDYIGGAEHAVMHLLYARFWTKVMFDDGLINFTEPFASLRNHGMILAPDGSKMSKSKGNTIEPDGLIEQGYGADTVRIMELFIGPWNQAAAWSVDGVAGAFRFLQRVWYLTHEFLETKSNSDAKQDEILKVINKTVKTVSSDLESMGFNTAIAALMECVNELYKIKTESGFSDRDGWKQTLETLLKLIAPFAPHISEELWHELGHDESIHLSKWPAYDEKYLVNSEMTIVIQINGKLRSQITVPSMASEKEVLNQAKADPKVASLLANQELKRTVYVPNKLVNFVI